MLTLGTGDRGPSSDARGAARDGSSRDPKVGLVITLPYRGGAQAYVGSLMASHPETIAFLATGAEGYLTAHARRLGIPVLVVSRLTRSVHPLRDLLALLQLFRLIKRRRPDLVHCNSTKAGILGRLAAFLAGTPSVYTAHGWAFTEGVPALRASIATLLEGMLALVTDRIICVSEHDRDIAAARRIDRFCRMVVIHNGIGERPPRATSEDDGFCRICMVARFQEQKDHETAIRAASHLDPGCVIDFIGKGVTEPSARGLAEELGVSDRINFLGERDDVCDHLERSDVFLLSTRWEGLPISIIEAMRCGLPVVATDVGGNSELIAEGRNGYLVPRSDPVALAERLNRLAADPALRRRMGRVGRKLYLRRHTLEGMSLATRDVYRMVLTGGPTERRGSPPL